MDYEMTTVITRLLAAVDAYGLAMGEQAAYLSYNPTTALGEFAVLTKSIALKRAAATLKTSAGSDAVLETRRFSPALGGFIAGMTSQKGHAEAVKEATASLGEASVLSALLRSGLRAGSAGVTTSVATEGVGECNVSDGVCGIILAASHRKRQRPAGGWMDYSNLASVTCYGDEVRRHKNRQCGVISAVAPHRNGHERA